MAFYKHETPIPDLWLIRADRYGDARGFFMEVFNSDHFTKLGFEEGAFVQDNLSSSQKGTLRGLHFQSPPHGQGKLVTVFQGSVLDVAVDIRQGSPTYGKHFAYELKAEEANFLYIPPGMAHGFQVLSDSCLFFYKCTHTYHKAAEGGVAWNDPALEIPWRDIPPIISEKDTVNPNLSELESPFTYERVL